MSVGGLPNFIRCSALKIGGLTGAMDQFASRNGTVRNCVFGTYRASAKDSAWISRWSWTIAVSRLPFPSRIAAKGVDHFLQTDLSLLIAVRQHQITSGLPTTRIVYCNLDLDCSPFHAIRWNSSSIAFGDSLAPRSSHHFRSDSRFPASACERASSSL
jgi:hypothetical protein